MWMSLPSLKDPASAQLEQCAIVSMEGCRGSCCARRLEPRQCRPWDICVHKFPGDSSTSWLYSCMEISSAHEAHHSSYYSGVFNAAQPPVLTNPITVTKLLWLCIPPRTWMFLLFYTCSEWRMRWRRWRHGDDEGRRATMTRIWVIRRRSMDAEWDRNSRQSTMMAHERDGNVMAMAMECPLMAV